MTKKTFIKKLKEKLSILDSEEVKDIIEEYESTIDEKIKNGEEEKKAIEDFGDIDELAKEILKAYKINPKYTEDNKKEAVDGFEDAIKKGASKLSDFTKGVVEDIKNSDSDFTIETIFELVLKAIILLIILAVLRLPFWMVTELGESLLDIFFFPLDKVLIVIWHLLLWIVYFAACILIAIAMFKNNLKSNNSKKKEIVKNDKKEETVKKEKIEEKEEIQEIRQEPVKKQTNGISNVLIIIAKVFITIVITIPLIFVSIGLSLAIAFMVYYCFVGINLVGPICILIAILIMVSYIADIFGNIFKDKKRHFLAPVIVSAVFLCLGITLTFIKANDYRYYEELDTAPFEITTESKEMTITSPIVIEWPFITEEIDETLEDNKIRIEYTYYSDILNVRYHERKNRIEFHTHVDMEYNDRVTLYNDVIENLKRDRFYNYNSLFKLNITVYGNSNTLKLVTID